MKKSNRKTKTVRCPKCYLLFVTYAFNNYKSCRLCWGDEGGDLRKFTKDTSMSVQQYTHHLLELHKILEKGIDKFNSQKENISVKIKPKCRRI